MNSIFNSNAEFKDLSDKTYGAISSFVFEKCGITFGEKKKPLVSARIRKRMRALNIMDPGEYFDYVIQDAEGIEIALLLDSMSTNVTSFFRESGHFDFLGKKLDEWSQKGQKKFRFWSSACSSGEEPYTIAFTINGAIGDKQYDVRILASDISTKMLGLAHQGLYEESKVKSVPESILKKSFDAIKTDKGFSYMVKQDVKNMVLFKRINLTEIPFGLQPENLDAVFCRNVMIYFDRELRKKLVNEFYRLIKPGGLLIVGHTESLVDIDTKLTRLAPSVYMKK
jgi:chemotaxis protein methyltransferase CheR